MGGRGRALRPPHLNPPPRRGEEMKSAMAPVEDLTRLRSLYRNCSG